MLLGYSYNVPIGTSAVTGGRPVPVGVFRLRIAASNACYITVGPTAVATLTTGTLISGGISGEEISVNAGDVISVIASTGGGTLNVTELN